MIDNSELDMALVVAPSDIVANIRSASSQVLSGGGASTSSSASEADADGDAHASVAERAASIVQSGRITLEWLWVFVTPVASSAS